MNKLEESKIKEIAELIDCGCNCFIHNKTNEVINIYKEAEDYYEQLNELGDLDNYFKIEVLEGFESFQIMENFVGQLKDLPFSSKLENALRCKKPFKNFNHLIHNSEYKQNWFDFKQVEFEKIVRMRITHVSLNI